MLSGRGDAVHGCIDESLSVAWTTFWKGGRCLLKFCSDSIRVSRRHDLFQEVLLVDGGDCFENLLLVPCMAAKGPYTIQLGGDELEDTIVV